MDPQADFPAKRINVLKIPVDVLPEDRLEEAVKQMVADGKKHQIVLLSIWDLLSARRSNEIRAMVNNASLVIPISQSIVSGARFLKRPVPVRYSPFDFAIKLMGALERSGKTVYLLGSRKNRLQAAERNIKTTFPGLRVVGRYAGFGKKTMEPQILEAIRKSTPTLLMVGRGMPAKERWIPRNLKNFESGGLYIWCDDLFDVFSEKRSRPPRALFSRGLESIHYVARKPWLIFRFFPWLSYKILLVIYRMQGR